MSENQQEPGKSKPPPPSIASGSASTPPPSLSAPPSAPPVAGAGAIKVAVKPDDEGDEEYGTGVPLGTRVLAALIDFGIAMGLWFAVVAVMPGFLEKLGFMAFAAYLVLRDGLPFLNGQSVGKTAMKIRAVTRDGKSLAGNWQPAVVRNVVLLIPFFPFIELIVLLTREDKPDQGIRLGDEWAKTKVVPVVPGRSDGEEEKQEEDGKEMETGDTGETS